MERFNTINPCDGCTDRQCGLIDGQECRKCIDYLSIKKDFEEMKNELDFTRGYIHDNGLEFDLLSKYSGGCCKNFIDKDLINRLQAENNLLRETNEQLNNSIDFVKVKDIAELKAENEKLNKENENLLKRLCKKVNQESKAIEKLIKAEAYKEFAERLKGKLYDDDGLHYFYKKQIDNLLKEMVGEDKSSLDNN